MSTPSAHRYPLMRLSPAASAGLLALRLALAVISGMAVFAFLHGLAGK